MKINQNQRLISYLERPDPSVDETREKFSEMALEEKKSEDPSKSISDDKS